MRITITRHGEKASVKPNYDGGPNPSLTDRGYEQARALGAYLADEGGVDELYSSCQLRALETAAAVESSLACEWHVWPMFYETHTRRWIERFDDDQGDVDQYVAWPMPVDDVDVTADTRDDRYRYVLSEVPERFPGIHVDQPFPWPDAWWLPLQRRTLATGYARADFALQGLLSRHEQGDHVLVVSHGNIGDKLVTALLDLPRRTPRKRFYFGNTAMTSVSRDQSGEWGISYANKQPHL